MALGGLFESLGLKRYIASALSVVVEVLRAIPGAEGAVSAIEMIAGFFGITGIGHATVSGGIDKKILATASSAIASLIALSYFIPALAQFRPILEKVAALLGAAALGARAKFQEVETKTKVNTDKIDKM